MTRCRVEQDELDFDTQQGQWKSFDDKFDSIFLDVVEDEEPEPMPTMITRRVRVNGKIRDVATPRKTKKMGDADGFQVIVEDK